MKTTFLLIGAVLAVLAFDIHLQAADPSAAPEPTVSAYWKLKQEKKWDQAYEFLCPAYKAEVSKTAFIKAANLDIRSFRIEKVAYSEDRTSAAVTLVFDAVIQGYLFKGLKLDEQWRNENSAWCFMPKAKGIKDLFKKKAP